ncbi:MAG: MATE family efflux transporter, partial [Lachnospiraceae bacterium]|nr:MATE family efflux transporter [Lachnospiraceae bacterium]
TLIVGRFLGDDALAAVGASFALMTFLTSILLGLCMGSGVVFSMLFGASRIDELKNNIFISFVFTGILAVAIEVFVLLFINPLLVFMQIPADLMTQTRSYLQIIFCGIFFTFLYNFFASLSRSIGNSVIPLVFLALSTILNIILDLLFILVFHSDVGGAALATVLSQGISALFMILYCIRHIPFLRLQREHLIIRKDALSRILQYSLLTCTQQSIMNFGILMVQGLVNSFGVTVMAAFAAAVKIDAFAYMPVQDFGNAFSTFIAQNQGAGKKERIRLGIRSAIATATAFSLFISVVVFAFADKLMLLFIQPDQTDIIAIGVEYLRIEGACYCGIGCLFLLYGLFRGLGKPGISVILTVISLG